MKSIRYLSDDELLKNAKRLAREEFRIQAELLWNLREIEARKLYARFGYSSLYEYVRVGLGYSEGAAHRRIASMRLVREVPEAEALIESGALSLSTAATLHNFFSTEQREKNARYSADEKRSLIQALAGKSKRDCEKELLKLAPERGIPRPEERVLASGEIQLSFVPSPELLEKLQRLKGLLAHKMKRPGDLGELIEILAKLGMEKWDPGAKEAKQADPARAANEAPEAPETPASRYIPAAIRRAVWKRAASRCEYRDPKTGARCDSNWALQIEHLLPYGLAGGHDFENLQLLCRSHNQLRAVLTYGNRKIENFAGS